jgi:hypothetical protein
MGEVASDQFTSVLLYLLAAIVVVFVVVAGNEWLRIRRERDIYRRTRVNASRTQLAIEQRKAHGAPKPV